MTKSKLNEWNEVDRPWKMTSNRRQPQNIKNGISNFKLWWSPIRKAFKRNNGKSFGFYKIDPPPPLHIENQTSKVFPVFIRGNNGELDQLIFFCGGEGGGSKTKLFPLFFKASLRDIFTDIFWRKCLTVKLNLSLHPALTSFRKDGQREQLEC